jgi:hypothetical protein
LHNKTIPFPTLGVAKDLSNYNQSKLNNSVLKPSGDKSLQSFQLIEMTYRNENEC